ncbi:glycosyltransferase [Flavobacterium kingsejongi]|uniref:Glycosyl transferase family 1 domain-containing protein n=1 Tax=Flavobacterium kingsejongi TaxID=1678728 RepID=A0A2S1LNU5_9FLAO|nr:glycosyltransferase [Flavobacterium kingsejongi]AWG25368.1 hypothetical protein FK004_09010 [Flavobacterium kingsejongi]
MRIIIDCTNLQVGGGIQVALSFLNDLCQMKRNEDFIILMSPQISTLIDFKRYGENFEFINLDKQYYKNFITRGRAVKKIENNIKGDVIFTVFGPSYHKSDSPKIVGYAIPHYIYEDSPFFEFISFKEKVVLFLMKKIKILFFKKNSDFIIFETQDAQQIFCKKYDYDILNTQVISNKLNQIFLNTAQWKDKKFNFNAKYVFLCLTANYKHKNLKIIPHVIDFLLADYDLSDFKFVISQTKEQVDFGEKYEKYIEYVGQVNLDELPALYESVDVVLMSTLLEVFSTTYLEAMFMKVPIVTTDLSFARDICRDAALYYKPLDAKDCATQLYNVVKDDLLTKNLIELGIENGSRFGNSLDRTKDYLDVILEKGNESNNSIK